MFVDAVYVLFEGNIIYHLFESSDSLRFLVNLYYRLLNPDFLHIQMISRTFQEDGFQIAKDRKCYTLSSASLLYLVGFGNKGVVNVVLLLVLHV